MTAAAESKEMEGRMVGAAAELLGAAGLWREVAQIKRSGTGRRVEIYFRHSACFKYGTGAGVESKI